MVHMDIALTPSDCKGRVLDIIIGWVAITILDKHLWLKSHLAI